nr:ATP-binding protein [Metamycoplasma alkalescens]
MSKKEGSNPSDLILFKEIIKSSIVKIDNSNYFSVFQFKGFDIFNNDPSDKNAYYQAIINALNNIDFPISFVKIPKPSNTNENFDFIEKSVQIKNNINFEFKQKYFEKNINDFGSLEQTENIDNYFLVVKSTTPEDLKNITSKTQALFSSTVLKLHLLTTKNLINFLSFHFNPNISKKTIEKYFTLQKTKKTQPSPKSTNKEEIFLDKILSPSKINILKDKIKFDKKFLSFQCINEFNSFNLQEGWANVLFNTPSTIIWNLTPLSLSEKQKILDKTIERIELNNNDEKSNFNKNKNSLATQVLAEITELINVYNMNFFNSNLILMNKATKASTLKEIEDINKNNAATIQANLNPNIYLQRQAYFNTFFSNKNYLKNDLEMVSRNIIQGWPWINNDLNDGNNLLWGFSKSTNSPIVLDIFKKTRDRTNFSMFVWGVPGSGKSVATSKLFLNYLLNGNSIVIIDPQREYKYLVDKLNGAWIELGKGLETTLNPLQLDNQFSDENQKVTNYQIVNDNIKKVCVFVKTLYPDFNENKTRALSIVLKKLYSSYGFYDKTFNLNKKKPSDFPIFTDLINYLESFKFDNDIEKEFFAKDIKELWINFKNDFTNQGQYQALYNGYTNINLSNDDFVVIDTYNLIQDATSPSAQAAMYLIMNYIQNKITNNFVLNKDNKKILIIVDEAHKFINKKNMAIIDFLFDIVKTIRKYNGSLILTTQQPSDFSQDYEISTKTRAIIENIDYSLILRLNQKDLEAVNEMYKSRGGLNKAEINFLASAPIGNGLMNIGSNNRLLMELYYNDFEKEIIFKKGDLSQII